MGGEGALGRVRVNIRGSRCHLGQEKEMVLLWSDLPPASGAESWAHKMSPKRTLWILQSHPLITNGTTAVSFETPKTFPLPKLIHSQFPGYGGQNNVLPQRYPRSNPWNL